MGGGVSVGKKSSKQEKEATSHSQTQVVAPKEEENNQSPQPPVTEQPKEATKEPAEQKKEEEEPITIPVRGNVLYIVGREENYLTFKYIPKGRTEYVLVRCPTATANVFIDHIDRYGVHNIETERTVTPSPPISPPLPCTSTAAAPLPSPAQRAVPHVTPLPANHSPVHQELVATFCETAAPLPPTPNAEEEEAVALAIGRSLAVKDDPRNYDLSPLSSASPTVHLRPSRFFATSEPSSSSGVSLRAEASEFDIRDDVSYQLRAKPLLPTAATGEKTVTTITVPDSRTERPPPTESVASRETEQVDTEERFNASTSSYRPPAALPPLTDRHPAS